MNEQAKSSYLTSTTLWLCRNNQLRNVETEVSRKEVQRQEEEARLSLYKESSNRKKVVQKFHDEMAADYQQK